MFPRFHVIKIFSPLRNKNHEKLFCEGIANRKVFFVLLSEFFGITYIHFLAEK
jgi:hypothetical protein